MGCRTAAKHTTMITGLSAMRRSSFGWPVLAW